VPVSCQSESTRDRVCAYASWLQQLKTGHAAHIRRASGSLARLPARCSPLTDCRCPAFLVTASSTVLQGSARRTTDVNGVLFHQGAAAGTYSVSFEISSFKPLKRRMSSSMSERRRREPDDGAGGRDGNCDGGRRADAGAAGTSDAEHGVSRKPISSRCRSAVFRRRSPIFAPASQQHAERQQVTISGATASTKCSL